MTEWLKEQRWGNTFGNHDVSNCERKKGTFWEGIDATTVAFISPDWNENSGANFMKQKL